MYIADISESKTPRQESAFFIRVIDMPASISIFVFPEDTSVQLPEEPLAIEHISKFITTKNGTPVCSKCRGRSEIIQ